MNERDDHIMKCRECNKLFDMRDLTQVMYHEVHRPVEVIDCSKGVRLDEPNEATSNLKEGDE